MKTWRHGDMDIWRYGDMVAWTHGYMKTSNRKRKTEAQAIFLNPFTFYSLCKRKFVICPFVNEETNRSYPFAHGFIGFIGLNGHAYLW
jgi:hypothetical protein